MLNSAVRLLEQAAGRYAANIALEEEDLQLSYA